jgi:hypothetical protein
MLQYFKFLIAQAGARTVVGWEKLDKILPFSAEMFRARNEGMT